MEKIQFDYEYDYDGETLFDETLFIKAHKLDIKFGFDDGEVYYIDVNGHEFLPSDDTIQGIIVDIKNQYISLYALMIKATGDLDDCRQETLEDIQSDDGGRFDYLAGIGAL
jgi:hypothetical protein